MYDLKSSRQRSGRSPKTISSDTHMPDSFPAVHDCRVVSKSAGDSALKMHKSSQSLDQYMSSLTQNYLRVDSVMNELGCEYFGTLSTRKKNFCRWANFFWGVRPIFVCSRYGCWVGTRVEKKHEKVTNLRLGACSMYI